MCDKEQLEMTMELSSIPNLEELSDEKKPKSGFKCSSPKERNEQSIELGCTQENQSKRSSIANEYTSSKCLKRTRQELENDRTISRRLKNSKTNIRRTKWKTSQQKYPYDSYVCRENDCGKKFKYASGLYQHKKNFHKEPIPCKICRKKIKYMNNHMKRMHPEMNKCKNCSKIFEQEKNLKEHDKSCTKKKPKIRRRNKKLPQSETLLKDDVQMDENQSEETRQPNQIGTIPEVNELDGREMRKTLTSMENPIICSICDIVVSNQEELLRHRRTHGAAVVICPICDIELNTEEELKIHRKTNHESN